MAFNTYLEPCVAFFAVDGYLQAHYRAGCGVHGRAMFV
jgi:hypothetical protein